MHSSKISFRSRVVLAYLVLFLLAVTWPGALITNRFDPQILGLPFNLAWPAGWVVLGFALLIWLDRAVTAGEDATNASDGDA